MKSITNPMASGGESPTHHHTSFEITDGGSIDDGSQSEDKPQISFILTMFNILCSSVGIGVLFLPSTLCGAGIPLGIASILLIGLAADWSSRALVETTCRTKSQSLEEMFKKVLGPRSSQLFSFSVFFLVTGALTIYIIIMGAQFNDVYKSYKEMQGIKLKDADLFNFRILSIVFSVLCGLSLLIKNLKMLSYVSMIKITVMILVLLISVAYAPPEYTRRREERPLSGKMRSFSEEFPLWPTLLGFMKAMGSWQTAYLFHMGVSEMYFSLKERSYAKWSKVSRVSVLIIATLNVCYALTGYLATADQLHPQKGVVDMCSPPSALFLSLYATDFKTGPLKWVLLFSARAVIVLILMATYPLMMLFLRESTISIVQNLAPKMIESRSKTSVNNMAKIGLWLVVTVCSLITENPFTITNVVVPIMGTIVVFLFPALCWMQIHGGIAYVFCLGLCGEMKTVEELSEEPTIPQAVRVPSRSVTPSVTQFAQKEEESTDKASVLAMLVAQSVVYLSIAFVIIGLVITFAEMIKGKPVPWRASVSQYINL